MSGASIRSWDADRSPLASVLTDTEPTDTDHFTVITVLGENPEPDMATIVPGGPMLGVSTRWGVAGGLRGGGRCCGAAAIAVGGGGVVAFVGGGRGDGGVVVAVGGGGGSGADIGTDSVVRAEKLAFR
jgi:hypothetical protein